MNLPSFSRRDLIKGALAAGAVSALPHAMRAAATEHAAGPAAVLGYLDRHARLDGGYAFADQEASHLTPTFAAIGSLRLLQSLPDTTRAKELAQFVRTHHPRELKKLEQERRIFEFQQIQALRWLGDDAADFRGRIAAFTAPLGYLRQYEQHGYPIFQSEAGLVQSHVLLGLPLAPLAPAFTTYLTARRRANGSFNNTPAADGGDGHVMNTLWGLQATRALGLAEEQSAETVAWLQACQRPGGGFTYQPEPMFAGVEDVAYTRAAVRALELLGYAPKQPERCVGWLLSLATADGGFSDRPGWSSNPLATFYALDALDALKALDRLNTAKVRPLRRTSVPANLRIFSAQIEAHGAGSPHDAVTLAAALKIDLWGAKNTKPGWLESARAVAAARDVRVTFFPANEEYGTWVHVPGLGTYSHTSDIIGPPTGDVGTALSNQPPHSWPEFREQRLAALNRGGGHLVWQFGENEELVRLLLDDSVERGGFAAISTFHFGNPDFLNTEPFLERWRGQIPYVALQDAHGAEPWWFSDMTTGFRTLFLAAEPTWDAFMEALRQNWVVAVRHDDVSRQKTWMHSGSPGVLEHVRSREAEWRWWNNGAARRPLLSLVALTPEDTFEAGRPDGGVALRVRCAWHNTAQGMPQTPLAELKRVAVDGKAAEPTLVQRNRPNGSGLADTYHVIALPELKSGRHVAEAMVRELATGREESARIEFSV